MHVTNLCITWSHPHTQPPFFQATTLQTRTMLIPTSLTKGHPWKAGWKADSHSKAIQTPQPPLPPIFILAARALLPCYLFLLNWLFWIVNLLVGWVFARMPLCLARAPPLLSGPGRVQLDGLRDCWLLVLDALGCRLDHGEKGLLHVVARLGAHLARKRGGVDRREKGKKKKKM